MAKKKKYSAKKHQEYLEKQLQKGIRYQRIASNWFRFILYAVCENGSLGNKMYEMEYVDYDFEEAHNLFTYRIEEQFLGLFDYSDVYPELVSA